MPSSEVVFTIGYILFSICIVAPPTEFVSAGLTIQNILGNFLGNENINFIHYHIRRTAVTVLVHSLLPLVYFIALGATYPYLKLFTTGASFYWNLALLVSLILPVAAGILVWVWSRKKWAAHPIAQSLSTHAPEGSGWHAVASSINIEFRRIDKFTSGIPGRRVIVTDSWILHTAAYTVHIAHQGGFHITLVGAEEHEISQETTGGVQILTFAVRSVHDDHRHFNIRLNALEYSDLKEKLQTPVREAQNVIVQQSLSERFIHAFRAQAESNDGLLKPPHIDVDQCIGCMQSAANVKLRKLCDASDAGECRQCFCRPMWCIECLGKWFASRQDQQRPETWLAQRSPCPTCRATFCVLDVSLITDT